MLSDLFMEQYKKAYKPMTGCYVLPYYDETFNTYFSEEKALQIAKAAETVGDEILRLTQEEALTQDILDDFEEAVREKRKDSDFHRDASFSQEDADRIFFVTDAFYNGGPFQTDAFEEATRMAGRANGDDVDSIDWKINLQILFYATIYTAMELSLSLSEEEIAEKCGWLFFCNTMRYMSEADRGQRYHIKTSLDETFDTQYAFTKGLKEYLLRDGAWQFSEEQIRMEEKERLILSVPLGRNMMDIRLSLPGLYDAYQRGGWNTVHKEISRARDAVYAVDPEKVATLLASYESARPHLILRPLNYADHRRDLIDHIFVTVGDIALVLYFVVSDHDGELNTTKVPAEQFRAWDVEKDDVFEEALLNNLTQAQPRIYTDMKDVENPPFTKGAFMAVDSPVTSLPARGAIVTTTRQTNGAIALFYPGVKEKIGDLFQDDFYVVFTGTSEAWVHPKSGFSPRSLLMGLKDSNKAFPSSLLSRKIYLFSREDKKFKPLEL